MLNKTHSLLKNGRALQNQLEGEQDPRGAVELVREVRGRKYRGSEGAQWGTQGADGDYRVLWSFGSAMGEFY